VSLIREIDFINPRISSTSEPTRKIQNTLRFVHIFNALFIVAAKLN
jgi:hypothetical protein